jgi:hypothetical protein
MRSPSVFDASHPSPFASVGLKAKAPVAGPCSKPGLLLVYFGYPQAHEDDAERAVRAGLGIVESVGQLRPRAGLLLQVRIGVATGLVVVGDIVGEGASEERAVLGDTPNLAARLQGTASPNSVVIGENTMRLVAGLFILENLDPQSLKGFSTAVTAYRAVGASAAQSRSEAAVTRGLTPIVGREAELGLLLKRWAQARDGEGQVILLSGEAGVGKSRIMRRFQERAESDLNSRVLYYCSPHNQHSALHPVIEQLKRRLQFEPDDGPVEKLLKLESVLTELHLPVQEYAPVLAALLSVPMAERDAPRDATPEELRRKVFEALLAMFEALAVLAPVMAIVEDAHWIDPSTAELLGLLIDRAGSSRLFLVVTHRPEYSPPWGEHAHATSLALNRLSQRESAELVGRVTGGKALPA